MHTDSRGYTLIELTVVIILIGLMLSFTMPRFISAIMTDDLKGSTQRIKGIITSLRNDAVREHKEYDLWFDLESNRYWVEYSNISESDRIMAREKASALPDGVRIMDIWLKGTGKRVMGEVAIRFNKKGYIQPSAIHLGSEDSREFTLLIRPFLGSVEVMDRYVEFEDI